MGEDVDLWCSDGGFAAVDHSPAEGAQLAQSAHYLAKRHNRLQRKPIADSMAIIKNSTPFDSIQKKFSGTDEIHFRNRTKDNATIGVRVKNPYDGGKSEAQQAVRNAFKAAQTQATTILADPEQRATYEAKFKAQKKYITLRGYVVAQVFAKQ